MSALPSVAEFDQLLAQARTQLGHLRETLIRCQAKSGEQQGMADVVAMLMAWDHSEVVSALAAALTEPASREGAQR
jgi:hypothetical protein